MAYIGNSPGVSSQRIVTTVTATAGQTTFTPSSGYTVGYLDVYLNGIKLINGTDYTASDGSTVVLTDAAALDDVVELMAYIPRGLSDGYTKSEADARYMDINEVIDTAQLRDGAVTAAKLAAGAAVPSQTGQSGKFLTTDGTTASWGVVDLTDLNPTSLTVPNSSTVPSSPSAGDLWYDTVNRVVKHYDGTNWFQMTNKFSATGGTVTTSGGFKYHAYTSSGSFTAESSGVVEILMVAGGGGGGWDLGGGGGAGGLIYSSSMAVSQGTHTVTVGGGGAQSGGSNINGSNGNNTAFLSATAIGGGGGGSYPAPTTGSNGGSGGGGGSTTGSGTVAGGSGTSGQGNAGGAGVRGFSEGSYGITGGGGGAGAAGNNGDNANGKGGDGLQYSQFSAWGSPAGWFAGGGGGSSDSGGATGSGGYGGGGVGNLSAGVANTGGGGGGAGLVGYPGGSGIVIIRYPI